MLLSGGLWPYLVSQYTYFAKLNNTKKYFRKFNSNFALCNTQSILLFCHELNIWKILFFEEINFQIHE